MNQKARISGVFRSFTNLLPFKPVFLVAAVFVLAIIATGGPGGHGGRAVAANLWADVKANGSDGPIRIPHGTSASISWSSFGADSCFVYSYATQWTGISGFGQTRSITSDQTYSLYCYGQEGIIVDRVRITVDKQSVPGGVSSSGGNQGGGQVLGAGDVVTGPEDIVLWSLGTGFVASLTSYYFFFARKDGWGFGRTVRLRKIKHAYRAGEDQYQKEFSRVVGEFQKQEKNQS